MSGSGGGIYVPTTRSKFDCENGIIITNVSSINIEILDKHSVGTILEVLLSATESVILEDGDGEILGSILHINTNDLVNCIKIGNTYIAEIVYISNPICRVQITRN